MTTNSRKIKDYVTGIWAISNDILKRETQTEKASFSKNSGAIQPNQPKERNRLLKRFKVAVSIPYYPALIRIR